MISIVTGTLNRAHLLPNLIKNTVDQNSKLELVLVDGGSIDNTISYIENLKHPNIKLIKYGQRSSYPHFMNLGVQNSKYEFICQWNDDVLLLNDWQEVINELTDEYDAWLFSWSYDKSTWYLSNDAINKNEIVMNYGIYRKDVFRKYGLYNTKYKYYYADGEMSLRAYCRGAKFKNLPHIKVHSLPIPKTAIYDNDMGEVYYTSVKNYYNGIIDDVELLND